MSILSRAAEILKANINDILDKAEDPEKMIDQYLRDLTDALAEVKTEAAGVIAEETRTARKVEENAEEAEKYEELAKKALTAGNEGDARVFIAKKQEIEAEGEELLKAYEVAKSNADKMRELHDKLVSDLELLKSRREGIKAEVAVAKTQERVNEFTSAKDRAEDAISAFDRMEEKADKMIDQANAVAELNEHSVDEAKALEEKYSAPATDESVDAELEKLKAQLGM